MAQVRSDAWTKVFAKPVRLAPVAKKSAATYLDPVYDYDDELALEEPADSPVLSSNATLPAPSACFSEVPPYPPTGAPTGESRTIPSSEPLGTPSAREIAEALSRRLLRLRRWSYDLQRAFRSDDVSALLDVGAGLVGHSLTLIDGAFELVSSSRIRGDCFQVQDEARCCGRAPEVSAMCQQEYRSQASEHPSGFMTLYPEGGKFAPVWSQPVRLVGETLRLHCAGLADGESGSVAIVREIADALETMLAKPKPTHALSVGTDFVRELVERGHDESEALARASSLDWEGASSWVAARVESVEESLTVARWESIADGLACLMRGSHVALPDETGFALVVPYEVLTANLEGIDRLCRHWGVGMGYGDPVRSLGELDVSYRQALIACKRLIPFLQFAGTGFGERSCATHSGENGARISRTVSADVAMPVGRAGRGDARQLLETGAPALVDGSLAFADGDAAGVPTEPVGETPVACVSFDACKLDAMRDALRDSYDTEGLEPISLRRARLHDEEHGTEYLKTMRALLDCEMSRSAACRELGVHRTTIDYRVRQLRERFGIDLDDAQMRELLRLSFAATSHGSWQAQAQAQARTRTRP